MTTRVYIAGPLFNTHERAYLEQIAGALEMAGYDTFLPHRDAGLVGDLSDHQERKRLFESDMQALEACDVIVALLTGADHDSGTCGELGYAYARGKPCFGITDDRRSMNNLIWGLCDEGKTIVRDIESLLSLLGKQAML
jgi:nucleoside 2-deoxyribosyltransferase